MKAKAHGDGARLTFTDVERETLAALLTDLVDALSEDGLQPGDPVYDRLYPAGYSGTADEATQQEFHGLTQAGLRENRVDRLLACVDELAEPGRLELDAAGLDRWLRVLNDVRLTVGTRLNITEDDEHWNLKHLDPGDPNSTAYLLYGWLTEVQDTVVRLAFTD